ncbi:hypothetical protein AGMMS49975_12400 [Clostridia bacterium]|nr:hypothetical protein AGMMS49975_12400 [Clostridia bacterium]
MNDKLIKVIKVATPVLGIGLALVREWLEDRKIDEKIAEAVKEALAE